ncbi:MAG: ATP-binding protein [Candidatus Tectomicrobia bacterium]
MSSAEIRQVLYELQVHQIELEMQNEELRRAQLALEAARSQYVDLFEFAPIGYFLLDTHGLILEVNLTGATLLGEARSSLSHRRFAQYILPSHQALFTIYYQGVFAKQEQQSCDMPMVKRDGTAFYAQLESMAVPDEAGNLTQWRMAVLDITTRKEAEEHLRQQEKMAMVGQLAGGVAHDFNNILQVIIGHTEMLEQRQDLPRDIRQEHQLINQQGLRAAQLVRQLLDFSLHSVSQQQALECAAFLRTCVDQLQRTIPENIRVLLDRHPETYWIMADTVQLQQVIFNLVTNARDAMPHGGEVSLSLYQRQFTEEARPPRPDMPLGAWLVVQVSDTGTGIAEDILPHLYEPFFTTKPEGLGTGLGLSQVYGIVRQHQGYIDIHSEVGRGTVVCLYFPRQAAPAAYRVHDSALVDVEPGMTLLLVEDDELVLDVTRELLEALSYRVLIAHSGAEALACYQQHQAEIALVMFDMVMPGMGGLELFRALRQMNPQVIGIIVSGYSLADHIDTLRAEGVSGYVQKPFNLTMIREAVRQALSSVSPAL